MQCDLRVRARRDEGRIADVTETTGASGIATSLRVIALHQAGTFTAQATTSSAPPVGFELTNLAGPAARIALELSPVKLAANGTSRAIATAVVTDAYGNRLDHERVVFSATGGQSVSPAPSSGDGNYSATVRATGRDGRFTIAAVDTSVDSHIRATATLTEVGSNRFELGRLRLTRRTGTATLAVVLPGSGVVILRGKGVKHDRVRTGRPRTLRLQISPRGALKRKLRSQGRVRITLRVTYAPTGGEPRTASRRITLRERVGRHSRPAGPRASIHRSHRPTAFEVAGDGTVP